MNLASSGLNAGLPARWPQIDGIGRKFGIWHAGDLAPAVFHREVEVRFAGHDNCLCCHCAERRVEITAVELISADIRVLPGPQHCQEIIRIASAKICFPAADQEIFERRETEPAPYFLTVEGLAQTPSGVNPAHCLKAACRWGREPAILPRRIGC